LRKIVYLAAYRGRRKRQQKELEPRLQNCAAGGRIELDYQLDGSYRATISGIYAEHAPLTTAALADLLAKVARAACRAIAPLG